MVIEITPISYILNSLIARPDIKMQIPIPPYMVGMGILRSPFLKEIKINELIHWFNINSK